MSDGVAPGSCQLIVGRRAVATTDRGATEAWPVRSASVATWRRPQKFCCWIRWSGGRGSSMLNATTGMPLLIALSRIGSRTLLLRIGTAIPSGRVAIAWFRSAMKLSRLDSFGERYSVYLGVSLAKHFHRSR